MYRESRVARRELRRRPAFFRASTRRPFSRLGGPHQAAALTCYASKPVLLAPSFHCASSASTPVFPCLLIAAYDGYSWPSQLGYNNGMNGGLWPWPLRDECGHTWSMQSMETIRRAIPLLISGYQGTGKSSTAARFNASAEIIDAEWLQAETARTIDPETPNPYEWDFWSGDRVLQLPGQLNRVFKKRYGTKSAAQRFLVLEAAILVKDWYLVALIGVLHLNRPDLLWSSAEFLVLDFDPALIHERIQLRAVQERPLERSITLEEVQLRATGYRDSHAKKSMFPWQFLASPIELEKSVRRIVGESPEVKKD